MKYQINKNFKTKRVVLQSLTTIYVVSRKTISRYLQILSCSCYSFDLSVNLQFMLSSIPQNSADSKRDGLVRPSEGARVARSAGDAREYASGARALPRAALHQGPVRGRHGRRIPSTTLLQSRGVLRLREGKFLTNEAGQRQSSNH